MGRTCRDSSPRPPWSPHCQSNIQTSNSSHSSLTLFWRTLPHWAVCSGRGWTPLPLPSLNWKQQRLVLNLQTSQLQTTTDSYWPSLLEGLQTERDSLHSRQRVLSGLYPSQGLRGHLTGVELVTFSGYLFRRYIVVLTGLLPAQVIKDEDTKTRDLTWGGLLQASSCSSSTSSSRKPSFVW